MTNYIPIERHKSRFFFCNLLTAPRTVPNSNTHVTTAQSLCKSRATHGTFIMRNMSCATWYKGTTQLLSLTEFKSHLFKLYFISWNDSLMKVGIEWFISSFHFVVFWVGFFFFHSQFYSLPPGLWVTAAGDHGDGPMVKHLASNAGDGDRSPVSSVKLYHGVKDWYSCGRCCASLVSTRKEARWSVRIFSSLTVDNEEYV